MRTCWMIVLLCWIPGAAAAEPPTEDERIERLASLGDLWGMVQYFHPEITTRDIDWDRALLETIPRVDAAETVEQYRAAVDHMLAFLDDPATRTIDAEALVGTDEAAPGDGAEPGEDAEECDGPVLERLPGDLVVLDARDVACVAAGYSWRGDGPFVEAIEQADGARAMVVDLRTPEVADAWMVHDAFERDVSARLPADAFGPALRTRLHSGYPPQTGFSSGGYWAGLLTVEPRRLERGELPEGRPPPMVLLLGEGSSEGLEPASALRSAGLARIVYEGDPARLIGQTERLELAGEVVVELLVAQYVERDGAVGVAVDLLLPPPEPGARKDVARDRAIAMARGRLDPTPPDRVPEPVTLRAMIDDPYGEQWPPPREYRLLALFRMWNAIRFFYAYQHLQDTPWEDALPEFLPVFEQAEGDDAYREAVWRLAARVQDDHVMYCSNALWWTFGRFAPYLSTRFFGDELVVVDAGPTELERGVEVGDVILEIDGATVAERLDTLTPYIAASSRQQLLSRAASFALAGEFKTDARLSLRHGDGTVVEVEVPRTSDPGTKRSVFKWALDTVEELDGGIGYADLARLTPDQVPEMLDEFRELPAIILDMRGYPHGTAWALPQRLTHESRPVAARFQRPMLIGTEFVLAGDHQPVYGFAQRVEPRDDRDWVYDGEIVVLIDETAVSQAEHTCLFLEAAVPDVTFVGRPTAGTNGDVTSIVLPGALQVWFTGHDVRHADGRQLQQLGIQPDIHVEATIESLIEGRDEILDAALAHLAATLEPGG